MEVTRFRRRAFIKAVSAAIGSIGLFGCGSQSSSASGAAAGTTPPAAGTTPPTGGTSSGQPIVIDAIPPLNFTGGIPGSRSLAQYVRIPEGYGAPTYALSGTLGPGLSFDTQTGVLSYDGSGNGSQSAGLALSVSAEPLSVAPQSGALASVTLVSAVGGSLLPWTFGQFFRQGDVPNGRTIVADLPDFQAVVRNRWPDGSVKYAVLSGRCDLVANLKRTIALKAGTAAGSVALAETDLAAAAPAIAVQVGGFGKVALSGAIGAPVRQLLSGPVASEWQYRLPVPNDAQLVVWLYVRLYKGGRVEFMVSIENGYFDYTGATNKVAQIVVSAGNQVLYDSGSAIDIKHHTRVVAAAGFSGKLWVGGDPAVIPSHDTAYLQRTGAVPAFQATSINAAALDGLAQAYQPNAQHNLPGNSLGGGGDSPSIGWLPRWDACYVVSADARAYKSVLVNSLAAGAWSTHWRNGATNKVVAYADFPATKKPAASGSNYGGLNYRSSQYGTDWDISHGWLPGYTAYLLTGDYWHLEALQFFVKWVHYSSDVNARGNATGLMVRSLQTRGTAWALRNCGMAAAITPDTDSERAAYANAVGASLSWMRAYHTNRLGLVLEPDQASWGDPGGQRTWMSDYVVGTVAWILDQRILAGAQLNDAQAFMQWMGSGLVQRFSDGSNLNGWHWMYQAYSPVVSPAAFPANQDQANFDANWGIAFTRNYGRQNGRDLDTPDIKAYNWTTPGNLATWTSATAFGAGYFEYGMCALAQCVNQGVAGAAAAFKRITAASNYNTCRASLANDPRFGIAPRG
ncbi:hypothetical protein GCM10025771_03110 [Niveibacterium umoris]|uniref:Uncharacterized protein n=1 Tax=Niveibacterium umoris TaxID=1193620 RepID=A0A840BUX9_9RHOO|nr:hypothetical protein [Niveibacterium umoris]MBB4014147.1 hypothetical protein [Niveibacterium umoris]